jgi:SAM-dependent methyltransferase
MIPTETDRQSVRLPGFLSPLYPMVRLVRLLEKYGLGFHRRSKPDHATYGATPAEFVEQLLRFANVSPGDVLYDLGCGDGRIVVAAAEKFGIRAVGVDISAARIAEARANARKHGVEDRVEFRLADVKSADVSEATIVTLYLETDGILRMVERLRSLLRPGARIVSRTFKIYGWNPDRSETYTLPNGIRTVLYLWTVRKTETGISAGGDAIPELRHSHEAQR